VVEGIDGAIGRAGIEHEVVVYPGVAHAFFWEGTDAFDEQARDSAWARVERLLDDELATLQTSAPAAPGVPPADLTWSVQVTAHGSRSWLVQFDASCRSGRAAEAR
jgi:hypothetical protein